MLSTTSGAQSQPDLAELQLRTLLESILGSTLSTLVSGLTDIWLQIGAVAAIAQYKNVQGSSTTQDPYKAIAELVRQYVLAALRLILTVPTLSTLWGAAAPAVSVKSAVNGLVATLNTAVNVLVGLINAVPNVSATYTAIDMDPLFTALENYFASGIVDSSLSTQPLATIDLNSSTNNVHIDLAALLGPEYGGDGVSLNGLAPNTKLLLDQVAVDTLTSTISTGVYAEVAQLLDTSTVNGDTSVLETILAAAKINITISTFSTSISLLDFLRGTPQISYSGGNPLISIAVGLVNTVLTTSGPVLTTAVQTLVTGLGTVLSSAGALGTLVSALTAVLDGLIDTLKLNSVLSIEVNDQWTDTLTGDLPRQHVSALLVTLLSLTSTPVVTADLAHAYTGPVSYKAPVAP